MPFQPDQFTNFATSVIAGGAGGATTQLGASDTSLLLATGDGAKLPTFGPFPVLLGSMTAAHEIVLCTARSGDTLTITRAQEGTSALTWTVGTPVAHGPTALSLTHLWQGSPMVYNVMGGGFNARGDGVTDDTTAINAAISLASVGGGQVQLPIGTFLISSTLVVNADNVSIVGQGWGSQLKVAAGWTTGQLIWYQAPGGGYRFGCKLADFSINGQNVSAGALANVIQLDSIKWALVDHLEIHNCPGTNIYMNGTSNQFGAYNSIRNCSLHDSFNGVGINFNNSEWCDIVGCSFTLFNLAGSIAIHLLGGLNSNVTSCMFDAVDTGVFMEFCNYSNITACQFDEGNTQFIKIKAPVGNTFVGNTFNQRTGSGTDLIACDLFGGGHGQCVFTGNIAKAGQGWTNFVHETDTAGGAVQPGNTYVDNDTGGYGMVLLTGTAKNNRGYNPLQSLAVPVAPVPSTAATGGTVLAGTYGVEVTYVNVQGESLPSANGPITTTGTTSTIKIPSPPGAGNAWGWYAYVTQVNGVTFTRQQTAGSPTPLGTNLTLTAPPTNTGANPPGANTTGGVTTPAVPATGVALQNTTGVDCTVVIATVGGLTAVTIGGLVLTAAPVAGSSYRVPSRQTITLTWATTAPTWQWIGD